VGRVPAFALGDQVVTADGRGVIDAVYACDLHDVCYSVYVFSLRATATYCEDEIDEV